MKRKKRNILLSILIGAFLLCAIAGGTFYYYLFAPQFHPSKTVYIYVDRDDTADSIYHKIQKIGQQLKVLDSEMKIVTNSFKLEGDEQAGLIAKSEVLTKQIDAQKKGIEELKKGLDASTEAYGKNNVNTLKWQKKTEPLQYEKAKKQYLESLEGITLQTTSYFFSVLSAQTSYRKSEENLRDTRGMYKIAQQRHDIGTVTKSELLQLELSMMNAELTVSNSKVDLEVALFNFKSYLGVAESTFFELQPPMNVPEVFMEYDFVLNKALQNSSHNVSLKIKELNSRKSVAQAKADRGIQVELRANLGFSQTGDDLQGVYSRLKDREVVGLSLSMPIYDWGMSRGRVKMAEAEARLARTELEQEETKFQQDIRIKVMQFNNQARQCNISAKALQVAEERYDITKKRFQNGGITVTDLNTAQKELDSASEQYINQLRTFWNAYFELRKLSLYDFISKRDISAEFDKIVEK